MILTLDVETTFIKTDKGSDPSPYAEGNQLVSVGFKEDDKPVEYVWFYHADRPPTENNMQIVQDALDTLRFLNKKAAPMVSKLIGSAMANATSQATVDVDGLVISEAYVDEGRTMKGWLPRAQGRATPLRKRSSHITIKLREV